MKPDTWDRIAMSVRASFRRFMDTNVYGTGSVKIWKTQHRMSADVSLRIFLQCIVYLLVTTVSHAKTAEPIEMAFDGKSLVGRGTMY